MGETKDNVKLTMPPALDTLEITVRHNLGIGEVIIMQSPAEFYEGKWHMELHIVKPGDHLRMVTDDQPDPGPAGKHVDNSSQPLKPGA